MNGQSVVFGLGAAIVASFILFGQYDPEAHLALFDQWGVTPARYTGGVNGDLVSALAPPLTHVFFHYGIPHLLMNGLAYLQAAPFVGLRLGGTRFLLLFFLSAIGGAILYVLINPSSDVGAVGASGAICGVFAAYFLALRPSPSQAFADPQVRNAMLMFLGINVVLFALLPLPIAWEAHLGGFIAGGLAYLVLAPSSVAHGPWG